MSSSPVALGMRWLSVLCLGLAGCTTEPEPVRNALVIVSGDAQRTVPGGQLPRPLVVRAIGPEGLPLAGVLVRWQGDADSKFESAPGLDRITDENGVASRLWIVGYKQGTAVHTATVSADGLTPASFSAESADGALILNVVPDPLRLSGIGDTGTIRLRVRDVAIGLDTLVMPRSWGTLADWNATVDVPMTDGSIGMVMRAIKIGEHLHWVGYGDQNVQFIVIVENP